MGKMLNVLLIIFLIEIGMALFITGCINPAPGTECEEQTSLLSWLLNPTDWDFSSLLSVIIQNVFLIGGLAAITVGTLWMKSEFLVYAGITATLFGFGKTLYRLWQEIANIPFLDSAIGPVVATLFLGGLLVYVFITMLDFARGRD